ncbi:MAG: Spy/CpxP family protein refolding chaperone [Caulobacteraceae bacterium]
MKPNYPRVALAAVLGLGLVVSAAAQDRGPGPGGPAGPRGGDRQKLFEDMQHRREQRLHDLLQIKPEQETAFRTFVSSLQQLRPQRGPLRDGTGQAGPRRGGSPDQPGASLTTPERLDRRLQQLQKETAAVKTFYAVLSPEQRKVFDEFPAVGAGRGMMMRGRFEGPGFR